MRGEKSIVTKSDKCTTKSIVTWTVTDALRNTYYVQKLRRIRALHVSTLLTLYLLAVKERHRCRLEKFIDCIRVHCLSVSINGICDYLCARKLVIKDRVKAVCAIKMEYIFLLSSIWHLNQSLHNRVPQRWFTSPYHARQLSLHTKLTRNQ